MAGGHGAESLQQLLEAGWDYHARESERLARELEAAARREVPSGLLAPFLLLATHTIGEHLGDWARALRLGRRALDEEIPTPETAKAWGRLYVAATLAGDFTGAAALELAYLKAAGEDFGAALLDMRFMLASALVGCKRVGEAARASTAARSISSDRFAHRRCWTARSRSRATTSAGSFTRCPRARLTRTP